MWFGESSYATVGSCQTIDGGGDTKKYSTPTPYTLRSLYTGIVCIYNGVGELCVGDVSIGNCQAAEVTSM